MSKRTLGRPVASASIALESALVIAMKCSEMKAGDVYVCNYCGLEIEVKAECTCSDDDCRCGGFECCGEEMTKK
jgi:hypothetical protein